MVFFSLQEQNYYFFNLLNFYLEKYILELGGSRQIKMEWGHLSNSNNCVDFIIVYLLIYFDYDWQIASESSFTAEDIASSIQQIFGFIHANTAM